MTAERPTLERALAAALRGRIDTDDVACVVVTEGCEDQLAAALLATPTGVALGALVEAAVYEVEENTTTRALEGAVRAYRAAIEETS